MEYVHTARDLHIYTVRKCVGFPKRYTFYCGQPIAECATRIHENVKCANSIYPSSKADYWLRREYMLKAYADLHNIVSQIEVANELFGLKSDCMTFWMGLVEKERKLVKGALKRDKERFGKLE